MSGSHDSIVVGINGSHPAQAALQWAARRAEHSGMRLVLVHVVADEHPDVAREEVSRTLLSSAREAAALIAPHAEIDIVVTAGDAVWALSNAHAHASAIVVGSHKTGFLHGSSFGSGSVQLAAASSAPVVVVPAVPDSTRRGVVVGIDDSPDGLAALAFAVRLADDVGEELTIVRVVPPARGPHRPSADRAHSEATAALGAARLRANQLRPDLVVRSRVLHGATAQALLRASSRASLLVVGRSRATTGAGAVGRVTHDLLLNLAVPTAVVAATGEA
jgi:nucleotide-binding universal stress UspA family protein